ncbi:MAG: HD domain-containing protein, partial [Prochlorococcaceae cyanobacterium]
MSDKSPVHSPRYIEALQWAAELHGTQRRKGKDVPYISHLIAVSALVWEDGG